MGFPLCEKSHVKRILEWCATQTDRFYNQICAATGKNTSTQRYVAATGVGAG